MKAKEVETESAQKAEPTQASSASATEAFAGQAAVSAAPEPRPLSPPPVASDDDGADRPTGAASEMPPGQRAEPPGEAGTSADRPAAPRPDQAEAERSATPPLAWLEGSAPLRDEMAGFARAQLEDAIATGQAILTCGSLPKALELQASYAVRAMQGNVAQALRLASLSAELMPAAFTPRKPL